MWRRLLSYFIPITIHREGSAISKSLEVTWANGQLVLDSANTNYSYGSLQRALRTGLRAVGYDKIRPMKQILVLGVAAGSVIKTLAYEVKTQAHITGIDIDEKVIDLARKFFNLDAVPNLTLVIDDAFEFTLKTKIQYDLIVVDIFEDSKMPAFLHQAFFANRLGTLLHVNGFILFNTMTLDNKSSVKNNEYLSFFDPMYFSARKLSRIESHNELLVIEKLKETAASN